MECNKGVDHGAHGDESEQTRRDTADGISEIKQADGKTTEDDSEVEPGEEGTLIREEDFGLDAGWEGDPLA